MERCGGSRARLSVKAKGLLVATPAPFSPALMMAQDPSVVVQVANDLGECWTAEFIPPDTRSNRPGRFKAKAR